MRLVIAEDLALLREGIASLLKDEGDQVLAAVGDADGLLEAAAEDRPDLAIVDVRMPPTQTDEGIRAAVELRRPREREVLSLMAEGHTPTLRSPSAGHHRRVHARARSLIRTVARCPLAAQPGPLSGDRPAATADPLLTREDEPAVDLDPEPPGPTAAHESEVLANRLRQVVRIRSQFDAGDPSGRRRQSRRGAHESPNDRNDERDALHETLAPGADRNRGG